MCYQVTAKNFARGFSILQINITTNSQSAAAGCLMKWYMVMFFIMIDG